MNYLTTLDRSLPTGVHRRLLFSGCDDTFRRRIFRNVVRTAVQNKKSLVIVDNGNLLEPSDLEADGYRVLNGLAGEYALYDPFRIDTLPGMIRFRNLLGSLGYSELQKQAAVQYLDFLSYVDGLDKPDGKKQITLELFGAYSTTAQVEGRLQQLRDQGTISDRQQIHLLTKYAELSSHAADFEKMLFLLLTFIRGEQLQLDTEGLAVVYPLKELDEDAAFCGLLTRLLSGGLSTCRRDRVAVVILDRGSGKRDYLLDFMEQLPDVELHLLSGDIFTVCTGTAFTSLKNKFTVSIYSRHMNMDSCAAVENSLGNIQVVKQSSAVQYDRRWRANSPWDILLGNNRTDITTTNAPIWEPRYPKEMIFALNQGSAILEVGGNSAIVTM